MWFWKNKASPEQTIKSGDNSQNNQAQRDIHIHAGPAIPSPPKIISPTNDEIFAFDPTRREIFEAARKSADRIKVKKWSGASSFDLPPRVLAIVAIIVFTVLSRFWTAHEASQEKLASETRIALGSLESGWVGGGSSANQFCMPRKHELEVQHPDLDVSVTTTETNQKSVLGGVRYFYTCKFEGVPK